jgi:hypothetical protein
MTVPARVVYNSNCDKCGRYELVPRGYGFLSDPNHKGFNLCRKCAIEWEKLIKNQKGDWGRKDWAKHADKLLTVFVKGSLKEKVQFT